MGKKIQRKNALMLAVGVVIITLLLAFKLDLSTFVATVSENISLGFYILISLSITLQLVCRAFRFNLLYNRIQPDRISFKNSLLLTGASLFFREKGVEVTAVTVIEYLFDTFAVVGIALVGTAAVYRRYLAIPVVTMLLLIAGLVGLYYLLERDVLARLPDRFTRLRNLAGKLQAFKVFFGAGLKSRFVLGAGLLFTGLFHAVYFLLFYAVLSQLKTGVALTDVLFSAGVGMFVGALTFIPMGIGTRDASTYGLLCSVGVDPHAAMASVIIMRSLTVWLILGSAVCYFAAVRTIARR
jgi:uncharacterized membrane protein YbhN (UPF0104 family)